MSKNRLLLAQKHGQELPKIEEDRDLNGNACWDASILHREPTSVAEEMNRFAKASSPSVDKRNSTF